MQFAECDLDFTLIICTYSRAASLAVTLKQLIDQSISSDLNWEIIIVDNADDPQTRGTVESFKSKLPISCITEKTPGQNSARNAALPHIRGSLVVFTDDDISPEENWISEILIAASQYPDINIFGGKIIPVWPGENKPWQADAWFSNFVYADQDLGNDVKLYPANSFPSSPNMAIRRTVFENGVIFNTKIGPIGNKRISGSESEFFSRALKVNKALYLPTAKVLHRITSNMMTRKYLRKRSYAMGLGMSVWADKPKNEVNLPYMFGVPRYRIGNIIRNSILTLRYLITMNHQELIKSECKVAMDYGFCIGIWRNLKKDIVDE